MCAKKKKKKEKTKRSDDLLIAFVFQPGKVPLQLADATRS
jgi:hypothetical protein